MKLVPIAVLLGLSFIAAALVGAGLVIAIVPDRIQEVALVRLVPNYAVRGLVIGAPFAGLLLVANSEQRRLASLALGFGTVFASFYLAMLSILLVTRPTNFILKDVTATLELGNFRGPVANGDYFFALAVLLASGLVTMVIGWRRFSRTLRVTLSCGVLLLALMLVIEAMVLPDKF